MDIGGRRQRRKGAESNKGVVEIDKTEFLESES